MNTTRSRVTGLLLLAFAICGGLPAAWGQPGGGRAREAGESIAALEKQVLELAESLEAGPPKRDLKVALEPQMALKLFRADPKLLENKFRAIVVLPAPVSSGGPAPLFAPLGGGGMAAGLFREFPEELSQLHATLAAPGSDNFVSFIKNFKRPDAPLASVFKLLLKHCPEDQRPSAGLSEYLTSVAEGDVGRSGNQANVYYHVFAPTAEVAEARMRAVLQLIDGGYCLPLQRYCLEEGRKALELAKKGQVELIKLESAITELEAGLAKPSEIGAEILGRLKGEKVMMDIELAGLSARIKACTTMLEQAKDLSASAIQGVGDLKIRAEIERIGIKEKLDQVNKLIGEGEGRSAARNRITTLTNEQRNLRQQKVLPQERRAELYLNFATTIFAPPQVEESQIRVAPVEWTN